MGGSSSHRRKSLRHRPQRHSNSGSAPITVPATARVLTFDQLEITQGPGYNLLCKSGWLPGQPIGVSPGHTSTSASDSSPSDTDRSGPSSNKALSAPLPIVVRNGRGGVGSQTSSSSCSNMFSPATTTHGSKRGHNRSHQRNPNRGQQNSSNKRSYRHSHPHFRPNNTSNRKGSSDSALLSDEAISPTLVKHLANLDIFDPLRPQCQFDAEHVVRDLKALHKHEQSCPANPYRDSAGRLSTSLLTPSQDGHFQPSSLPHMDTFSYLSMDSPRTSSDFSSATSSDSDNAEPNGSDSDYAVKFMIDREVELMDVVE